MKRKSAINKPSISSVVIMVLAMLIFLIPLSFVVLTSLKTYPTFLRSPLSLHFTPTFTNFVAAWQKADISVNIFNSIFYTLCVVMVSLLIALLLAFPVARHYIPRSGAFLLLFTIGMFLPDGTIPQFQLLLYLGLYDTRLGYILALLVVGGVPFLFLVAYIQGIPKELDEAAVMDGCGYFRYLFTVILPLCRPALVSLGILIAITSWNEIPKSIILLSRSSLYPIQRGLMTFSGQYSTNWTQLMAAIMIVALPLIVLYIFLQKHIVDGMTAGSIKM